MHPTSDNAEPSAFDRAVERGDHENAVRSLFDLANQGHTDSLLVLSGFCLGNEELGGDKCAIEFLQAAAERGNLKAQCRLGQLYDLGLGVAPSERQAFFWFSKAAELGLAEAQCWLALLYIEGKGVRSSNKRAVKWLTRAAAQGDGYAQGILGTMYASGYGTAQNRALAIQLLSKAANQGIANAQFILDLFFPDLVHGPRLPADVKPGIVMFLQQLAGDGAMT